MKVFSRLSLAALAAALSANCGGEDANFSGVGGKLKSYVQPEEKDEAVSFRPEKNDPKSENVVEGGEASDAPVEIPRTSELFWLWPCEGVGLDVPVSGVTIEGAGNFDLMKNGDDSVAINIRGGYCQPKESVRDITFVVDVSDSMYSVFLGIPSGNDPVKKGSCGRYKAVKSVVDSLNPGDQVSLVTFGNKIYTSAGFQSVAAFKAAGLLSVDKLCEQGKGTQFELGLIETEKHMLNARSGSFKEAYFISDGKDTGGEEEAERIRQYATIATLMLKGNDTKLKKNIASKDTSGNPIHIKVDDAADLAGALKKLSESSLVGGKFSYSSDSQLIKEISLDPTAGKYFSIPQIVMDPVKNPDGMTFEVDFYDSLGRHYGGNANMKWK